jgi:hypothetical protein
VGRWADELDLQRRELGEIWQRLLRREIPWKMAHEKSVHFQPGQAESASIFSAPELIEQRIRALLPDALKDLELRVDVARHYHRPGTAGAAAGQNFLYDPATRRTRSLADHELFARLPLSFSICRVYARNHEHDAELAAAVERVFEPGGDAKTNM